MIFKIIQRDGPAKIGDIIINKKNCKSPNIFFIENKRYHAPAYAEILITDMSLKSKKPLINISDLFFYSKDVSKDLHLQTIKLNKSDKKNYCIIPCNKDTIEDSLKDNSASLLIILNT